MPLRQALITTFFLLCVNAAFLLYALHKDVFYIATVGRGCPYIMPEVGRVCMNNNNKGCMKNHDKGGGGGGGGRRLK